MEEEVEEEEEMRFGYVTLYVPRRRKVIKLSFLRRAGGSCRRYFPRTNCVGVSVCDEVCVQGGEGGGEAYIIEGGLLADEAQLVADEETTHAAQEEAHPGQGEEDHLVTEHAILHCEDAD